ncbi:MAG TPA: hypothetical protein VKY59_12585 [Spirillospora sp.]|nr:hypothetical protein [Spirillospora sp.]
MVDQAHPEQQAALLRAIAERLGLPPVKLLVKEPGVLGVYRVTVYYHDRRARDSCATLVDDRRQEPRLSTCYRGAFGQRPITYTLTEDRYEAFVRALQKLRFDHLRDQPGMPLYGLDFWMIERAAGSFVRSVIVAPQTAQGAHAQLVGIIREHLPEALRAIE